MEITDEMVEIASRAMCKHEGIDPEWKCVGIGSIIPVGETWHAWAVRAPKVRDALQAVADFLNERKSDS